MSVLKKLPYQQDITSLLAYSMVRDILRKADSLSACQTLVCFIYGTRRFITALTKARYWTYPEPAESNSLPSIPVSLRPILRLSSTYA